MVCRRCHVHRGRGHRAASPLRALVTWWACQPAFPASPGHDLWRCVSLKPHGVPSVEYRQLMLRLGAHFLPLRSVPWAPTR